MAEKLGVGSTDTEHANFIYLNEDTVGKNKFRMTRRVENLAKYADAKDACSACYGSLIYALDRLSDAGSCGEEGEDLHRTGVPGPDGGDRRGSVHLRLQEEPEGLSPQGHRHGEISGGRVEIVPIEKRQE